MYARTEKDWISGSIRAAPSQDPAVLVREYGSVISASFMLHKQGKGSAFVRKYKVHRLVWYEFHQDFGCAIEREKRLKNWHRAWKINLIEASNPDWEDIYESIQMWAPID